MVDPVKDGDIKTPSCGFIKDLFGLCSRGIAAPMMPNVAAMDPAGQKIVTDKTAAGDYGEALKNTNNAIQQRFQKLDGI